MGLRPKPPAAPNGDPKAPRRGRRAAPCAAYGTRDSGNIAAVADTTTTPIALVRGRRPRAAPTREPKPRWLLVRPPGSPGYIRLKRLMRQLDLHTVCEEANCPNIGECWDRGTATFMILGDVCTRSCGYCNVMHGRPGAVDSGEPERVAAATARLQLRHVV
ncbi:MAG: hypothetical protein J4F30_09140, partial [Acidobacteria bacterium]|nr:hypothetical protein [Acidobacteriota bacterium]